MSIGELRAALDAVAGLAAEARGHAAAAAEQLGEAVGALTELAERSGETLPVVELGKAREEVDVLVTTLNAAAELVADLGARL
ncbi:hypothetical protein GCM10009836_65900 [Pseudonocardia ailaonensis]|uniref:Uncharacterized protein n=1 Tax=Pseudonocardia ailaonensis TaxID=367279 RepID=A0ABN2NPB3_9PSEU